MPKSSVSKLLDKYKETGRMDMRTGSKGPKTASMEENGDDVKEMISSQGELRTLLPPQIIGNQFDGSPLSVCRMIKDRGINHFKRSKTPSINGGTKNRFLLNKFRYDKVTSDFQQFSTICFVHPVFNFSFNCLYNYSSHSFCM